LIGPHHVEIVVRRDPEEREGLVEQFPVLPRGANE